ncbi:MAG: hypothetical protein NTW29_15430 [Bacteroidetes bacterium]|nr:hypothetical protein [Bacteroidota bacterium]
MKDDFEVRKQKLLAHYQQEYAPKEPTCRWLQSPATTYEYSRDIYERDTDPAYETEEITLRLNKKEAAHSAAFLLLLFSWMYGTAYVKGKPVDLGGIFFFLVILVIFCRAFYDRRPRIIMDKAGIWSMKIGEWIGWHQVILMVKKTNTLDDHPIDTLVIHLYVKNYDEFMIVEIPLNELDLPPDRIICIAEQFRQADLKKSFTQQVSFE